MRNQGQEDVYMQPSTDLNFIELGIYLSSSETFGETIPVILEELESVSTECHVADISPFIVPAYVRSTY